MSIWLNLACFCLEVVLVWFAWTSTNWGWRALQPLFWTYACAAFLWVFGTHPLKFPLPILDLTIALPWLTMLAMINQPTSAPSGEESTPARQVD